MGTNGLPDIYTLSPRPVALRLRVYIYQVNHKCTWYNYYVPLPCTIVRGQALSSSNLCYQWCCSIYNFTYCIWFWVWIVTFTLCCCTCSWFWNFNCGLDFRSLPVSKYSNEIILKKPWKLNSEVSKTYAMYKLLRLNYKITLTRDSNILARYVSKLMQ